MALKEARKVRWNSKTLDEAASKIDALAEYLTELKQRPITQKVSQELTSRFMLSYFWELQNPELYPVFYGSAKNVLESRF